jgi:transcriptional regulator with XRE-family HTH domain
MIADYKTISGALVRDLRISAGLSQADLAEKTGYSRESQSFVAAIEAGRRGIPRHKLKIFAAVLGVEVADLI